MKSAELELFELSKSIRLKQLPVNFAHELLFRLTKVLNSQFCILIKFNEIPNNLVIQLVCDNKNKSINSNLTSSFNISITDNVMGMCLSEQRIINLHQTKDDQILNDCIENKLNIHISSILAIPIIFNGKLLGVVEAINKIGFDEFTKEDEKRISIFTTYFALYFENQRMNDENQAKSQLFNLGQSIINSAHGLKNILNNIDGGVFIVEKGTHKKNMDDVTKGWDIVRRNSNRVRDLVLDILLYSRPKKPEYKLCNINDICNDIKDLMEKTAELSNVEIKLILEYELKLFFLDPKGIYRSILNLLSNALTACEEKGGGRVTIQTKSLTDNSLQIIVSDTGTGISKDNIENIFTTFFTTKGSKGTGLGLPVTKKIINEHNGDIKVKSLLNVGTTFIITIPEYKQKEETRV